jgi:hypothetical protein
MLFPVFSHMFPMFFMVSCSLSVVGLSYCCLMVCLWFAYGFLMVFLWSFFGDRMVVLKFGNDFL